MVFKPGDPKPPTSGRTKGTPNKVTVSVREAVVEAFHKAGGAKYLETVAQNDPRTFCALVSKLIPQDVRAELTGAAGGPIVVQTGVPIRLEPQQPKE